MFYLLGDEFPYPGQHAPHGKVGLPLATRVLDKALHELQELLGMLTSRANVIEEAVGGMAK
jgi:hypothetical protein